MREGGGLSRSHCSVPDKVTDYLKATLKLHGAGEGLKGGSLSAPVGPRGDQHLLSVPACGLVFRKP